MDAPHLPTAQHGFSDAAQHLTEETLTAATDKEGDGQVPIIAKLHGTAEDPQPRPPAPEPQRVEENRARIPRNAQSGMSVADVHRIFTSSPGQSMML